MGGESNSGYARLPDELLEEIMDDVHETVKDARGIIEIDRDDLVRARDELLNQDLIRSLQNDNNYTNSIVAVDGGMANDRLPDMDISIVHAAGVEGLRENFDRDWGRKKQQYVTWQGALPHSENNVLLTRGIMALAEMIVLAHASHDIRLLDGSHMAMAINLSKLLTADMDDISGEYLKQLDYFMKSNGMGIGDIPNIVKEVMTNSNIVASTKYNSSRILVDNLLKDIDLKIDDKSLFSYILNGGEYLVPQEFGLHLQSNDLLARANISYRLNYPGIDAQEFEWYMNEAIGPIKIVGIDNVRRQSNLCYMYFRPYDESPVYKLEIKREVAEDKNKLELVLNSIAKQVVYPDIIEPYPQYLSDLIAKSTGVALRAVREAVLTSTEFNNEDQVKHFIRNYRT